MGFLEETRVLPPGGDARGPASAFVQLTWPWVRTVCSDDLPGRLEPPEGLLAGILAENALSRGTFRSVAGTPLPRVIAPEPVPDTGVGPDSPAALLARRVCLIGPEPGGITLLSDVTGSGDTAWRPGGVSRLMATLLRAARRVGEAELFAANGPELWKRIRRSMEELLDGFLRAGALGGASPDEAYQVRCGLGTMTQSDLDNGRVRVEITVLPAAAVEHITVSLDLGTAGSAVSLGEVA
jgi:phage tail sheath protein FI